jgi:hypothetical protein
MIVNNELEGMWKEAVVNLPGGTEKNDENSSQDSRFAAGI